MLFVALAGVVVSVPRLIEAAYAGTSHPLLNAIIDRDSGLPLQHYLDVWRRVSVRGGFGLLFVIVGGGLLWRRRAVVHGWLRRTWLAGEPWTARQVWAAALVVGIVGGMVEGLYRVAWHVIENHPSRRFAWEWVWLAPWGAAWATLVVATGFLAVAHLARRRGLELAMPGIVAFVFGGLSTYAVLSTPPHRLASYAVVLLSVGLATALGQATMTGPLRRRLPRAWPALIVVLLAITAVGAFHLPGPAERRRMARLPDPEGGLPNILLVILDTVRAADLSLYGYERPTTPWLRQEAQRGVLFTDAISPSSWTLPAHASMFTGRWPGEHAAGGGEPLGEEFPTLAEALAGRGYQTAAFVANFANASETSGLARGFARYQDFPITGGRILTASWLSTTLSELVLDLDAPHWRLGPKTAEQNTDDALEWLAARAPDRPFFVFMNYTDAHSPYRAPDEYQARFPSDEPVRLSWFEGVTQEKMRGTRAAYDASIAYLDAQVARLVEGMRARSGRETIVVVTSDHGELLGEHGLTDHGNALYMPLLAVPLLVEGPGVPANARVERPVSLVDLPATLLDLAVGATDDVGGRSLAALWQGDEEVESEAKVSPAFAEIETGAWIRPWEPAYESGMASVVTEDWHYIRSDAGVEELFDRRADPDELNNLLVGSEVTAEPEIEGVVDRLRGLGGN